MQNWKSGKRERAAKSGAKAAAASLRKALALLLTAGMLVTMLPLAGLAAFGTGGVPGGGADFGHPGGADFGHPGGAPSVLAAFTAQAASNPTSGSCGNSVNWSYSTGSGTLTISGSGDMWDWDDPLDETAEAFAPWLYYYHDKIKTITIQSGVTGLGAYAFAACEELTSVSIPNSVTVLRDGAFQGCVSLKSVSIPDSVKTIQQYAFAFCDTLGDVTVPASVTKLSNMAFFYSRENARIKVASGNTCYKDIDGVVYYKDNNELMIYPSGRKDHIYTVPEGTRKIGGYSMCYNDNLRAVILPESVVTIGEGAFLFDENLLRVGLPAGLRLVEEYVFSGCSALRDVYYAGTKAQRSSIVISEAENDLFTGAAWHYQTAPEDAAVALFEDVAEDIYYADPVKWAAETGVTTGTSDITFSPDDPCTRAQMVTFLWRAAGSPEPAGGKNPFSDIETGSYYEKAVLWAVSKGITSGTDKTHFSPNDTVDRGQTVTFLYRWKGSPAVAGAASNPFQDVSKDMYYYQPVLWAVKNGVTSGTSATIFSPKDPCTRAQIVTFLYRAK